MWWCAAGFRNLTSQKKTWYCWCYLPRLDLMSCWIFPYQCQGSVDNTNPKDAFLCPIWWPLPNAPPKKTWKPQLFMSSNCQSWAFNPPKNPSCVFLWVRWNLLCTHAENSKQGLLKNVPLSLHLEIHECNSTLMHHAWLQRIIFKM